MARTGKLEASLGTVVREHRIRANLSQERLAEAAGLHRNYIGLVERGVNSASIGALAAIAAALNVPVWEILREAELR